MKKTAWILIPAALAVLASFALISCKDRKSAAEATHQIQYDLGRTAEHFAVTPAEAKAGETVEIRTKGILMDADIHVYVDGQEIQKSHYDSDYWGYSFVMPDEDVLVTARFYTTAEVWGLDTEEVKALKEKFPEYFDLETMKGLEVYVWQMAKNSYSFGLLPGTNRLKTPEELWNLRSATAKEMRAILSTYDIGESYVTIIPVQKPISSYIADYWVGPAGEDAEDARARKQQYLDRIREMLFGDDDETTGKLLLKEGMILKASVTSLPGGYDYSLTGEAVEKITDYISGLHLLADFPEDPDEYGGMVWVISLEYLHGETLKIYHFGNLFIRAEAGPWYKMTYEEASRFGELLNELNNPE